MTTPRSPQPDSPTPAPSGDPGDWRKIALRLAFVLLFVALAAGLVLAGWPTLAVIPFLAAAGYTAVRVLHRLGL